MKKGQWHRVNGVMRKIAQGPRAPHAMPRPTPAPTGHHTVPRAVPDPPYDPDDPALRAAGSYSDPSILASCSVHDLTALVDDAWSRLTVPERVNLLGFRRKMTPPVPAKQRA